MIEAKDILEMRSNKVWDEETAERVAPLPRLVENKKEELTDKENFFELKTAEDAPGVGSLAAAEAVQAATDERRRKEVTKAKIEN